MSILSAEGHLGRLAGLRHVELTRRVSFKDSALSSSHLCAVLLARQGLLHSFLALLHARCQRLDPGSQSPALRPFAVRLLVAEKS